MKIYLHPASTACRPVMLFAAESRIAFEAEVIDLFTGEQLGEPYSSRNPNRLVPMLEDGDFRLTESSAILKFLADRIASPCYPADPRKRARINERMDWFNTQLGRDFAYGFIYPQIFPQHHRESPLAQDATLRWHRDRAKQWLQVLDRHIIGPDNDYVCGSEISIADYLGAPLVALGEIARVNYADYPHVRRWMARMKALQSWSATFAVIDGYAASIAGREFEALEPREAG